MAIQTITPEELGELLALDAQIDLIDVRTRAEYERVHVEAALNVPLDSLDPGALAEHRKSPSETPIYVVCQSGLRSRQACEKLREAGVVGVSVEGGTPACERGGIAVKRGRQTLPLDRQVWIVAGMLVAVGAVLSAAVSPWFLVVPGFVGCGLIFAGITEWCGMGLLRAKMRWNHEGGSTSSKVKPITSQ